MDINCDLSPSSATKTTPRLISAAVSMSDLSTRCPAAQTRGNRHPVEGLAHRGGGSPAGRVGQYVDTTIGGYSPSLSPPTIVTEGDDIQAAGEVRLPVSIASNLLMPQAAWQEWRYRDG